jgi:hypothetical protein
MSVWGGEATFQAILSPIGSAKPGYPVARIFKVVLTTNADGSITVQYFDVNNVLQFTLNIAQSGGSQLIITRTE